jgi:shikimate dehydrogenase
VGAVNTVMRTDKGDWSGTNTDVEGFLAPLKTLTATEVGENDNPSSLRDWSQTVAIILGYGGAARAVVAGCAQLGCAEIRIVGRDPKKLKHFLKSWRKSDWKMNLSGHSWEELPDLISQADLLVNATPVGQKLDVQESPLSAEEIAKLRSGAIAYDLIYNPNPTLLLQQAQAQGAIAIDGLEMLVQQGASALKFWLQREEVPVDVMRQSLRQHLGLLK